MKRKLDDEKYDICTFCMEFWGEDRHSNCKSACTCASYANQDYVYQREIDIGLPRPIPWPADLVPKGDPVFWRRLSEQGQERLKEALPGLLDELEGALKRVLTLLLQGATKEEVCKELTIGERTYDKYTERLLAAGRDHVQSRSKRISDEPSDSEGSL